MLCVITTLRSASIAAPRDDGDHLDAVTVSATRTPTLVSDAPLPIEAVPAVEIEENLTVQPGNLSSLLHELPSVRVQSSAPALGGAGLQLRGMPARNTLVLTDGLPSLGAEPDAFNLLQTPPLDLKQVEVIKGAASALYGGAALGGVLNLVSQSPAADPAVLANINSRGGRDLVGFLTHRDAAAWGETLTVGVHDQSREDINGDGWADIAGYRRYTLRPRAWWSSEQGQSLFLTAGYTDETRRGGTLPGHFLPDASTFEQALETHRFDVGAVVKTNAWAATTLTGRYSATFAHVDRTFGAEQTNSSQTSLFAEETLSGTYNSHKWVAGVAFERVQLAASPVRGVGYTYNVPAILAQDDVEVAPWIAIAGSARVDANNAYGTYLSPRTSVLLRIPASPWSLRASIGTGFSAPTPFLDEIEATGLGALLPLRGLHAERAVTESLDAKWAGYGWDVNVSVFNSEIGHALSVKTVGNGLELVNSTGTQRAPGAEALVGFSAGPLHALASWSYIDATQTNTLQQRQGVPLVPSHTASLDAIWENEQHGRVGLELDYTGKQTLDDDPYRTTSRPYWSANCLAELRVKSLSIFVNAINFTNVRQTRFDPLLRPSPGPGGNPITEVWAPLDGRVFNIGLRAKL